MTLRNALLLIAADTRERARLQNKRYGLISYLNLLLNPHALAVIIYRFQHWLHTSNWARTAEILRRWNVVLFSTDIGSAAEIGEHFLLLHANCIFVGNRVRIGRNVYLMHHNTIDIGPRPGQKADDLIVIEDNVMVGSGARIVGNLTIGHDTFIGSGTVVSESLPACSFHVSGAGETPPSL